MQPCLSSQHKVTSRQAKESAQKVNATTTWCHPPAEKMSEVKKLSDSAKDSAPSVLRLN